MSLIRAAAEPSEDLRFEISAGARLLAGVNVTGKALIHGENVSRWPRRFFYLSFGQFRYDKKTRLKVDFSSRWGIPFVSIHFPTDHWKWSTFPALPLPFKAFKGGCCTTYSHLGMFVSAEAT